MLKKINEKINQIGLKRTIHLIIEKIKAKLCIGYNFTLDKNNLLKKEWTNYWKGYKYIEKKYKKILLNMELKEGAGKTSNKVWWCWLQGEENAPLLQRKCLNSLREHLIDKEIIIITNENLYKYIELPDYIKEKYKKGYISNTHFSDLVRLQLLIKYGGTWIDSTTYCTGFDEALFNQPLFVYKNINNIWYAHRKEFNQEAIIADNWFISAEKDNPILIATRDLLFDYWKKRNYLVDYFIFHYFFTLVVNYKYNKEFNKIITRSHLNPHILQSVWLEKYDEQVFEDIKKQSTLHKLTHKVIVDEDKDCFCNTIINNKECDENE